MTDSGYIAIAVVAAVFLALSLTRIAPYLVLLAGMAALLLSKVLSPAEALAGFSNPGMITIALLFVVAAGLRETGLTSLVSNLLGRPASTRGAQVRLALPVTAISGFLSNTPLVAMLIPTVRDWSARIGVSPSKLLIPLSYASIVGGMCTLIGTSTNLVVHGLLIDSGREGLGLFDVSIIGIACAAVGLGFLFLFADRLLPSHDEGLGVLEDPKEFTVEMVVEPGGNLVGKTLEEAGLRHLPNCYLAEIHRGPDVFAAVSPKHHLEANDQLVFVGLVDSVVELQRTPGLVPATTQVFKLDEPRSERWFVEAVISHRCPVAGQTIRDSSFRSRYGAVVLAVARDGQRVRKKIGDIVLEPGDILLLEAPPRFVERHRNANDFYLVSRTSQEVPPSHERAGLAAFIFAAMVALAATGRLQMLEAALLATVAIVATRLVSQDTIRKAIDWQLLLAIAAAFSLGRGLEQSGAARLAADLLGEVAAGSPWLALACVCVLATVTSELITNNAAAVLIFPIAMQIAEALEVSHMPFAVGIMLACSASFATPLGYQTNLMVYGAGGYRFRDFVRIGLPMDLLMLAVIIATTPFIWPF